MSEQEPVDAHFEAWRWSLGAFRRYRVGTVEGRENWIIPGGEILTEDYLNALESDLAALRQQLAEIVPHVRRWVENLDYEEEAAAWLERNDALASPSRDTGSEEGR